MPNFQYVAAKSVDEALSFLAETADSCKIIAGGTDLIPALRNEEIRAAHVLNILDIEELKCIREEQDVVRIGSTVTITEIIHADVLKQYLPILVNAASDRPRGLISVAINGFVRDVSYGIPYPIDGQSYSMTPMSERHTECVDTRRLRIP